MTRATKRSPYNHTSGSVTSCHGLDVSKDHLRNGNTLNDANENTSDHSGVDVETIRIGKTQQRSVDTKTFPDQPLNHYGCLPATVENFEHLLGAFGILVRFNVTTKKVEVIISGHGGSIENAAKHGDHSRAKSRQSAWNGHRDDAGDPRSHRRS